MAQDRFIWWDQNVKYDPVVFGPVPPPGLKENLPSKANILREVLDYVFGVARIEPKGDRLLATFAQPFRIYGESRERFFEVVIGDDNVDVLTREMDDITNAIADGLAHRLARKFKGRFSG